MTWIRSRGLIVIGGAAFVVAIGVALTSPTIATTGPLLVMAAAVERYRRCVRERARSLARLLPPLVDGLIQQLRAGRSLSQSCATLLVDTDGTGASSAGRDGIGSEVAWADGAGFGSDRHRHRQAIHHALAPMVIALRGRETLGEAASALLVGDDPSLRLFAVTIRVLAQNGGPAVPALQRLRHTLIGVVHGSDQADAQASQSMASAGLMATSPLVVAVVIGVLHRDAANLYLFEPVGAVCVFCAVALSCLGWWWMQHNVAKLERRIA